LPECQLIKSTEHVIKPNRYIKVGIKH